MRSKWIGAAVAAMALAMSPAANAQDYPSKTIMLMMPFAAGGPGDTITRIVGQGLSTALKQQTIVENTSGAGGTIGTARIAAAAPDGYSLLVMHIGQATNVALYPNLKYDAVKDFEPIGLIGDVPMAFVARKDFPANTFTEMIAYVKANKASVNYAHAGIGSASHLCGLMFFNAIGIEVRSVPYRGTGPAMNDLVGGQVDFMCDQTVNVIPQINGGAIKSYAVTTKAKVPTLPNLPTAESAGLKGFDLAIWYAMYAPKGTPKPVIDRLVDGLQKALADATVKQKLGGLGVEIAAKERATPDALRHHLTAEIAKWTPVIKKSGVTGN